MSTANTPNTNMSGIEEELDAFLNNEQNPRKNDLLSQIAAEDIENEKKIKQKKQHAPVSFSKLFTVALMRITLFIDTAQHKYSHVLNILRLAWSLIVGLIYFGGLCSLLVLGYAYQNYPSYIQNFFDTHHINLSNWQLDEYTLSRIVLTNLKDEKGAYSIDKMIIRSDFSDFLNKRIKSVSLDGVNITIQETTDKFEIGYLAELLVKLNQATQNGHQIGSVSVTNATAVIQGKKYNLPVQFSMTGFYEHSTSISIPLTIKQSYMNVSGMLSISGTGDNLEWTLDILSGNLSFPNEQPENISGQLKFQTTQHKLSSVNGVIELVYGKNKKNIKIDLKDDKSLMKGTVKLSFVNQEVANKTDETKTDLTLGFDGLNIKNLSHVESNKAIRLNLQSLTMSDLTLSNASGVLNGKLICTDFVCSYEAEKNIVINIQSLKTNYQGNTYVSKGRTAFTIIPNKRPNLILQGKIGTIDLSVSDFSFNGYRNTPTSDFTLTAKGVSVSGKLGEKTKSAQMRVNVNGAAYESSDIKLNNATVSINDIWQDIPDFQLNAKEVFFKNSRLVKIPVTVSATRRNNLVKADISLLNNTVQSKFNGTTNLLNGTFQGTFAVKSFNLKPNMPALNTLSNLFPAELQNVTGNVALYGKINWKNEKQISGPFYLSLADVNFNFGNMQVQKLNTVLMVQTLTPFTTSANQELFVQAISNSLIPLQNIHAVLKFDNQMTRLNTLNVQSGGISLSAENMLLPYRSNSTIIYLKNPEIDLDSFNSYWSVPNMTLTGSASITLPIEIRQNMMSLNNSEIKLNNALLKYTGTNQKIKNALFSDSPEYIVKSGNILLSQVSPTNMDAYFNFDGRTLPNQVKTVYKDTILIEPKTFLKTVSSEEVPESIRQKQEQIFNAASD